MDIQGVPPNTSVVPAGSVVVTPSQMYAEQRATHEAVTRIETIISPLPKRLDDLEGRLEALTGLPAEAADHETRLRALEQWGWKTRGVAAVMGVVCGGLGGAVVMVINSR